MLMLVKFLKTILLIIIFSFILAVGGFFYAKYYLQQIITVPSQVYIPKGSTKSAIKALQKSGIDIGELDYHLVKLIGYPQAGWITLEKTQMSRSEFLQRITHSKAALRDITLIPGETKEIFFEQLEKKLDLNSSKLLDFYTKMIDIPDGVIFANTYKIPVGVKEKALIKYLVENSIKKHKQLSMKYLKKYDQKSWFEDVITKASIIQKEAADTKEMPLISAVIKNRLKRHMKLQMDGTLNYQKFSHIKVTAKRIREDNSSYNTYKIEGLPPYPICSVDVSAIKAALNPANVKYLYFVKGKDGKHHFSNSYKAHLKAIPK